jgi:hypothetical protein
LWWDVYSITSGPLCERDFFDRLHDRASYNKNLSIDSL